MEGNFVGHTSHLLILHRSGWQPSQNLFWHAIWKNDLPNVCVRLRIGLGTCTILRTENPGPVQGVYARLVRSCKRENVLYVCAYVCLFIHSTQTPSPDCKLQEPKMRGVSVTDGGPLNSASKTPCFYSRCLLIEIECLLYDSHQQGKMMIMITKTSGSHVDSTVAEGKRKEGGGRKMRDLHKDT